jgi:predicted metal-dependent peptidase
MSNDWQDQSTRTRISAANYDCMRHPDFSVLAGVIALGAIKIDAPDAPITTAATDGVDVWYSSEFLSTQNRKQTRAIVLHENFHKALKHCIRLDPAFVRSNHALANVAMDFVVNGWIYTADPKFEFFEWWEGPAPLLDPKYFGWSVEQIINDLMKRCEQNQQPKSGQPQQGADGQRGSSGKKTVGADDMTFSSDGSSEGSMDEHVPSKPDGDKSGDGEGKPLSEQIDAALRHGKILSQRLRSKDGTGGRLDMNGLTESKVRWQDVLREFMMETVKGADIARWSRINNRMYSATRGMVVLPTLYDEKIGPIVIAGDTSGSMRGFYPVLFGEVAAICKLTKPESVQVLWWDTEVAGEQKFTAQEYDFIASAMQPAGGGGTEPSVVYDWLRVHNELKPQCVIFVTDGYIGEEPFNSAGCPVLWCVIDNSGFTSKTGKTVHVTI